MNCFCSPPLPAIIKKVSKSGDNYNKEFFSCFNSKCKLFHWVGAPMPTYLGPSYIKDKEDKTNIDIKPNNLIPLKVVLNEFEEFPPKIWFSIVGSSSHELSKIFQNIPNNQKIWKENLRLWMFDFTIYERLISLILALNQYKISELPRFLITGLKNYVLSYDGYSKEDLNTEPNLTEVMLKTLLPFQLEGVKFVIKHKGKALIADEMGCGKTIQAIACIQHYAQHRPVLILAPVNLLLQWKDELIKFLNVNIKDICVIRKGSDVIDGPICLVPYSILENLIENGSITSGQFPMLIADESHHIKSKDSKRTIYSLPLIKNAKVSICLTGTPALNRPVELYTQLNGLLPYVFNDYDQFALRYCDAKKDRFSSGLDTKGSSNESELKLLLNNMIMIRRLKSDVINNLPNKSREIKYCKPDMIYEKQLKDLDKRAGYVESQLKDINTDESKKLSLNIERKQILNMQYQVTGMSKISAIRSELKTLIDHANKSRSLIENNIQNEIFNDFGSLNNQPVILNIEDDIITEDLTLISPSPTKPSSGSSNCNFDHNISKFNNSISEEFELHDTDSDDDTLFTGKNNSNNKLKKLKRKSIPVINENDKTKNSFLLYDESDNDDILDISGDDILNDEVEINSEIKVLKDKTWDNILGSNIKNSKSKRKIKKGEKKSTVLSEKVYKGLGQKILVFAHHLDVLDAIESFLNDEKVGYIRIDSNVTAKQKNTLISKFQADDQTDVALLSVTSCGTGLNLTTANVALFAELYWSPGVVLQAEDRIHRIGQKSSTVRIIYLIARNTADEIVWDQIQKKHNVIGATVGIADNKGHGMFINKRQNDMMEKQQLTLDNFFKSPEKIQSATSNSINRYVDSPSNISNELKESYDITNVANLTTFKSSNPYEHLQTTKDFVNNEANNCSMNNLNIPYSNAITNNNFQVNMNNDNVNINVLEKPIISTVPGKRTLSPSTILRIENNKRLALEKKKVLDLQKRNINNNFSSSIIIDSHIHNTNIYNNMKHDLNNKSSYDINIPTTNVFRHDNNNINTYSDKQINAKLTTAKGSNIEINQSKLNNVNYLFNGCNNNAFHSNTIRITDNSINQDYLSNSKNTSVINSVIIDDNIYISKPNKVRKSVD